MSDYYDVLELFKDKKKQWRWRIRAKNGLILASSEAYSSRGKAEGTVNGLQDRHPEFAVCYDKTTGLDTWGYRK